MDPQGTREGSNKDMVVLEAEGTVGAHLDSCQMLMCVITVKNVDIGPGNVLTEHILKDVMDCGEDVHMGGH